MVTRALLVMLLVTSLARGVEPSKPDFQPNHPVEDFFTVTLVSTPFTALWSLLGASVVAGISQQKFPPEFSDSMFIGAAGVALGASVSIGLVSVAWGRGKTPTHPKSTINP